MILLDTNIFIYLANGTLKATLVAKEQIAYASICKIEALGYQKITAIEKSYLEELFAECLQSDLDNNVIDRAVLLRLQNNMTLGDAIVAATAIENDCELWTANVKDFGNIEDLKVFNPLNKQVAKIVQKANKEIKANKTYGPLKSAQEAKKFLNNKK
jgi:predicted nucleic acid-binding protein